MYEENVGPIYSFFGYRVRSQHLAEDLTQATFERALRAWDRFDPRKASARTWLTAIAHNLLIDEHRRANPAEPTTDDPQPRLERLQGAARNPGDSHLEVAVAADLRAALDSLGARERELIALRFGADLTGPEIAEIAGLSLANTQQILSRALRKMRVALSAD